MSNPNDWLHINGRNHNPTGDNHQQPIHHHQDMFGRRHAVTDAPASENFSYTSTDQMNLMGDGGNCNSSSTSSSSTHLNPERRASRGAPVTLLNTDASNFRAMVQQFTGVPNPPFSLAGINNNHPDHAAAGVLAGTNLNFQIPRDNWFQHHQDPSSNSVMQQLQQQQFMFALNNNNSTVTTSGREQVGSNHQDQLPGLPNFE
ncbi:VQ motif-containing protein 22-like [Papaver somniferum]|uniref:VQ motif-containing protein 22-like n=1 Tax=Papaver somniferum TaxID=3469 RepID=UPI000E6F7F6C|nr:VQ motif-containing protein 22-like [Papaver somniferum]